MTRGWVSLPPSNQPGETEADGRAKLRDRRWQDRAIFHPLPCRGRGCRLHVAALVIMDDSPPRPALRVLGPFATSDPAHGPGDNSFVLSGEPRPDMGGMFLPLDALPRGSKVRIRCSCGHRSEIVAKVLQEVARATIMGGSDGS